MKTKVTIPLTAYMYRRNGLFSKEAYHTHLRLYEGYIDKINQSIDNSELDTYNANGVLLHELFFKNIDEARYNSCPKHIKELIMTHFGSYEDWQNNFKELCMQVQSKGWVCLIRDSLTGKLKNIKLTSHDAGLVYGSEILIINDMYEHSYMPTYELDKEAYIDRFFLCIDWNVVELRIIGD